MKKIVLTIWILVYALAVFAANRGHMAIEKNSACIAFGKKLLHPAAGKLHQQPKQFSFTPLLPAAQVFAGTQAGIYLPSSNIGKHVFIPPLSLYILHSVYRI